MMSAFFITTQHARREVEKQLYISYKQHETHCRSQTAKIKGFK